jgi:ABC-type dipeptide/oligopeptide/nickel transport system permease subunit
MFAACVLTLPWSAGREGAGPRRFEATDLRAALLPPFWAAHRPDEAARREDAERERGRPLRLLMGSDRLGRDLFARCLAGGAVSLAIGLAAAAVAVGIGTGWGMVSGSLGRRGDAVMMRVVDVLYGLPSILLVVLLAVAAEGAIESRGRDVDPGLRQAVNLVTLFLAIGGVSWLTLARVVRGQVLSLRERPFMEAARAIGAGMPRRLFIHLLPNLAGPIIVYATLTVPAAILAESFLSFLGIGVREPLPSWGNLAAGGLSELNPVRMRWWLLVFPCLLIALTLLSLNFVGEALREALDPRRAGRVAPGGGA